MAMDMFNTIFNYPWHASSQLCNGAIEAALRILDPILLSEQMDSLQALRRTRATCSRIHIKLNVERRHLRSVHEYAKCY